MERWFGPAAVITAFLICNILVPLQDFSGQLRIGETRR